MLIYLCIVDLFFISLVDFLDYKDDYFGGLQFISERLQYSENSILGFE